MRARAVVCLMVGVGLMVGCGTHAKQIPSGGASEGGSAVTTQSTVGSPETHTPVENKVLDEFFFSSTQGGAKALNNLISYTMVADRELLDGAVAFCGALKTYPASGQGALSPADFEETARRVSTRFDGRIETTSGDIAPDGPMLLTRALGIAAVHKMCPELARSLG